MTPLEQGNFAASLAGVGLAVICIGVLIAYGLGIATIVLGCLFVFLGVLGVYVSKRRREHAQ